MALKLSNESKNIEVIAFIDEAIGCTREVYADYLENLDESLLELKEGIEPTRFVLRRILPLKFIHRVKKEQASVKQGGIEFNLAYMITEIQCALVDIKNPPESLVFKKNKDGAASDSIVEILETAGILNDLFVARQNASKTEKADPKKS